MTQPRNEITKQVRVFSYAYCGKELGCCCLRKPAKVGVIRIITLLCNFGRSDCICHVGNCIEIVLKKTCSLRCYSLLYISFAVVIYEKHLACLEDT